MTTFRVSVDKLRDDDVDDSLSGSDVLAPGEVVMDKYIRIEFESFDPNMSDIVSGSLIKIYYTSADLDLTGDGDGDDPEDINESTLALFLMSADGRWIRLSDLVDTTGVNTTNVELFGVSYEGYVWANVSGLSLFGIAGQPDEELKEAIPWMLIALAAIAVILLLAAGIAIRRRKPRAPKDEPTKAEK